MQLSVARSICTLHENREKKSQQRLLIPFSKLFLKHRHRCLLFMLAFQLSPSQPLQEDRKEEDNLHLNLMVS